MVKKLLIILSILVLSVASTTPALAEKPPEAGEKGNTSHQDQGKGNDVVHNGNGRGPAEAGVISNGLLGSKNSFNSSNSDSNGFDEFGYNRTARIFNGTAWNWCMGKVGNEAWCTSYLGIYAQDKLVMKWNAEWDHGNKDGWTDDHYDAWENNQWNGKVPGGSGEVWHYKIVWVGPCGKDGTPLDNGGYCLWGQFEVLADHGTADGVHTWLTHATPNGYGSYP